jgi:hypothetical protein
MSIHDAQVRVKQLNSQTIIRDQEKRIQENRRQEKIEQGKNEFCLPVEFVAEFEKRFLRVRDSDTTNGRKKRSRAHIIWRAAQKAIAAIHMEPSEWFYHTHEIYDHFHRQRYSVRYIHVILKFMNLWGFFICRKLALPFLGIPCPKGYERARLIEANYEKQDATVRRPSLPLSPEDLSKVAAKLNQPNLNWLYLSIWLGLRPQEIDNLHNKEMWRLEKNIAGKDILWVFQTKIVALPIEDRWKPIPIIFDEQKFAIRIIESNGFKRPITKTMRKYFGPGTTLYAGRKGFTDLMISKGQILENISVWMGHSTLDRTWRSYKQKRKFHLRYSLES